MSIIKTELVVGVSMMMVITILGLILYPNTQNPKFEYSVEFRERVIEEAYPEFKDFESQDSFAGKRIEFEVLDDLDYYFAYITLGSGVPVVKATCFRVDPSMSISKIGEFPEPVDSVDVATGVDPKTCRGIQIT